MKAIVLKNTCKADELKVDQIKMPTLKKDSVLVKVNAFGINRSEIILRAYEADEDYIHLPIVPGIECVGTVVESSNDKFNMDDKVIALMGGMGRSFNGSYEEYAVIPMKNVFKIKDEILSRLDLEEIASIPETYFTAYGSLFESLKLNNADTLLIRGGSSATGLTAMNLAKALGCTVISTTRNKRRVSQLLSLGADYVLVDDGNISDKVLDIYPEGIDKILELVGPSTMNDSMKCLCNGGICCITGILGDEEIIKEFNPIKDIPNGKFLSSFFSNYPSQEIIDDIFDFILKYKIKTKISKVFDSLEDMADAHMLMESNNAEGKIIVKLEEFK